jgi:hypothetical protein
MWCFTSFGILMPSVRPAHTVKPGDPRTMQVRARRREYLEHFAAHYVHGRKARVISGQKASGHKMDYPWRLYVTPDELKAAMAQLVDEIVEDKMLKFKPTTEGHRGLSNKKLASQLHSFYTGSWSDQLKLSDGTSSYDYGNWTTAYYKPVDPATCPPVPSRCEPKSKANTGGTGLHWYPSNWKAAGLPDYSTCYDCGYKRPAWTPAKSGSSGQLKSYVTTAITATSKPEPANCSGGIHLYPSNAAAFGKPVNVCFDCGHVMGTAPSGTSQAAKYPAKTPGANYITSTIDSASVPIPENCDTIDPVHWYPANAVEEGLDPDTCYDCGFRRPGATDVAKDRQEALSAAKSAQAGKDGGVLAGVTTDDYDASIAEYDAKNGIEPLGLLPAKKDAAAGTIIESGTVKS